MPAQSCEPQACLTLTLRQGPHSSPQSCRAALFSSCLLPLLSSHLPPAPTSPTSPVSFDCQGAPRLFCLHPPPQCSRSPSCSHRYAPILQPAPSPHPRPRPPKDPLFWLHMSPIRENKQAQGGWVCREAAGEESGPADPGILGQNEGAHFCLLLQPLPQGNRLLSLP